METTPNQTSPEGGKLPLDVANVAPNGTSRLNNQPAPPAAEEARPKTEGTPKPAETPKTPEAPKPKTYTEEELGQRIASIKGGHEGTVKKMREELAAAQKAVDEAAAKATAAQETAWLRAIEESGGDVKVAQGVLERDRAVRVKEQALAARERELASSQAILNEAGKTKIAYDLLKTYELPESALVKLTEGIDPQDPTGTTQMENRALKLRVDVLKTRTVASESLDKGPKDTKGVDISKMTIRERLGAAAEGKI